MAIKVLCSALQNKSIYHLNVAYYNNYPTLMKMNHYLANSGGGCPEFGPEEVQDREHNV